MLREFRWNILVRVILITGLALALAFVLLNKPWFFTPLVIGGLLLLLCINLIYYIEKTNKDFTHFILSIRQTGYTTAIKDDKRGHVFEKFSLALNDVLAEFREVSYQREAHYQYLQLLTEHIGVGIISFDEREEVQMINPAAKQLLGVQTLSSMTDLKRIDARIFNAIRDLTPGNRTIIRGIIKNEEKQLMIQAQQFVIDTAPVHIVLLQDLNRELEEKEMDAWQKLIRVQTHEIMNSITPVVTLSAAINTLLHDQEGMRRAIDSLDAEDLEDVYGGLKTIEGRARGLLKFVSGFKNLTTTPDIRLSANELNGIIKNVINLFRPAFEKKDFVVLLQASEKVMVMCDASWLEQVIINVLQNASDALEDSGNGNILISVDRSGEKVTLTVKDNGPGMDSETLEKIFIPFFTTRKQGSGIGLSLCRQIMKLHRGNITVTSEPGKGTAVMLELCHSHQTLL